MRYLFVLLALAGCTPPTNDQLIKAIQGCEAAGMKSDVRYDSVRCYGSIAK